MDGNLFDLCAHIHIFFRYMLALAFIGKAASLLFFFLAWWTYIPPGSRGIGQNSQQQATATLTLSNTSQEVQIVSTTIA